MLANLSHWLCRVHFVTKHKTMTTLTTLLKSSTSTNKRDCLYSSIVFFRTSSLEDKPRVTIAIEKPLDWNDLSKRLGNDKQFLSLSAHKDLLQVVQDIKEVSDDIFLQEIDGIQICRSGIAELRVVIKGNSLGRIAYLEINDYRSRLLKIAGEARSIAYDPVTVVIIFAVFSMLLTIYIVANV